MPTNVRDQQTGLFVDQEPLAIFSPYRRYRYTLHRGGWRGKGLVNFCLLNPSKATETVNDNTVCRCISYARDWGFADLVITNLFAWRSTDRTELLRVADPVGPDNDEHLCRWARRADLVVCGWGVMGTLNGRSRHVRELLRDRAIVAHALRLTASGEPGHPLYLPGDATVFPMEQRP